MTELNGKNFLVTGATSGIGAATCAGLAARGARVLAVGRAQERIDALLRQLPATGPTAHRGFLADLSSLQHCAELARRVAAAERVDVIINNVGAVFPQRQETEEGVERTLALNHLGPFVLTDGLLETLRCSPCPRVVNVASQAHAESLDLTDLQGTRRYDGMQAYQQSKLLNILYTRELHNRHGDWLVTGCLHPGVVQTALLVDYDQAQSIAMTKHHGRARRALLRVASRMRGRSGQSTGVSTVEGAVTTLFVATSTTVRERPGRYWREAHPAQPSPVAEDDAMARRIWEESERLVHTIIN